MNTPTLRILGRRLLSTSALRAEAQPGFLPRDPFDIMHSAEFKFDEIPTAALLGIFEQRGKIEPLIKIEQDRRALQGESASRSYGVGRLWSVKAEPLTALAGGDTERGKQYKFQPPNPNVQYCEYTHMPKPIEKDRMVKPLIKYGLRVPISRLPLKTPEAVKRFQLLAGNRYIDPQDIETPMEYREGLPEWKNDKAGWIYMSEARFENALMNRKWLSDVLDRMVEEANVSIKLLDSRTRFSLADPTTLL